MATAVLMPKLGMTMEEGTVIKWFKKEGDEVKEGEPLLEILTDKLNMEAEAPASGVLLKVLVEEGKVVPVNTPIAYIGKPGEKIEQGTSSTPEKNEGAPVVQAVEMVVKDENPPAVSAAGEGGKLKATPAAKRIAREEGIDLAAVIPSGPNGRILAADVMAVKASPLAKKIAADKNIDLATVQGTGIGGKIMKADVENAAPAPGSPVVVGEPVTGLRKVIAKRMSESWQNAPHVTLVTEADMTEMIALRAKLIPGVEKRTGVKPSYTDLIVKVVARALSEHKAMNARFYGDTVEYPDEVNVGLAVAISEGLMVPVVHRADRLSVADIACRTKDLVKRARDGKLLPDELSGGTFTVTNLGNYGIDAFTPIINPPEVGILGVGRILEKPVVKDGQIVVRSMMTLSLSFDHRAVDGAPAAEFLARIKELLEDPMQLI